MSNIKVFPMAMLPGWPFAPTKLQAPRLKIFWASFSNSIQPVWGFGLPVADVLFSTRDKARCRNASNLPTTREDETIGPVVQAGDELQGLTSKL